MVLVRPGLVRVHRLGIAEIDDILTDIVLHAVMIEPQQSAHQAPDRGDQFLYDLLAIRADLVLITGDQKLLNHAAISGRVLSPRQFIESM